MHNHYRKWTLSSSPIMLVFLIITMVIAFPAPSYAQEGATASTNMPDGFSGSADPSGLSNDGADADYFTGAGIHMVNIPIPAGRAGVMPKVFLRYNSHNRYIPSEVGMGWEFSKSYISVNTFKGVGNPDQHDFVVVDSGDSQQLIYLNPNDPDYSNSDHPIATDCEEYQHKIDDGQHRRFFRCTTTKGLVKNRHFQYKK